MNTDRGRHPSVLRAGALHGPARSLLRVGGDSYLHDAGRRVHASPVGRLARACWTSGLIGPGAGSGPAHSSPVRDFQFQIRTRLVDGAKTRPLLRGESAALLVDAVLEWLAGQVAAHLPGSYFGCLVCGLLACAR